MKKRMSLKTFLTKLRRLRGEFTIDKGGMIRTADARTRADNYRLNLCPIERVAEFLGEPASDESLPLHSKTRSKIINAADDRDAREPVRRVRNQMLKALKLREV